MRLCGEPTNANKHCQPMNARQMHNPENMDRRLEHNVWTISLLFLYKT